MTVKLTGRKYEEATRHVTGLYSFDRAFGLNGEVGFPTNIGCEIMGVSHIGKTTFTLSLAALIAEKEKGIVFCDFEETNPEFIKSVVASQGFDDEVYLCHLDTNEEALGELVKKLKLDKYSVGIVDSIAAISPVAEQSGDFGEANWGRRAMLVAQLSRKMMPIIRGKLGTLFLVNHFYPQQNSKAWDSPGGEVKKYISHVRIHLASIRVGEKKKFPDGSYLLKGTVKKNKCGGSDDKPFIIAIKAGEGISRNLTALFDCKQLKLVTTKRTVKLGDQDFGYLKTLVENHDDDELFAPFHKALEEYDGH